MKKIILLIIMASNALLFASPQTEQQKISNEHILFLFLRNSKQDPTPKNFELFKERCLEKEKKRLEAKNAEKKREKDLQDLIDSLSEKTNDSEDDEECCCTIQ